MIEFIWIGQAGLLIRTPALTLLCDPYLSDSVAAVEPQNRRRVPVDRSLLSLVPDVILLTHNHLDHTDPDTLCHYLTADSAVTVLAAPGAWQTARKFGGLGNNYVRLPRHAEWSVGDVRVRAVPAVHSDPEAVGFLLTHEGKNYYITGDTLYSEEIFADLPDRVEALFLPINGVGNNLNPTDAARFAARVGARRVVPYHVGMFDSHLPTELCCPGVVVPQLYQKIALGEEK